MPLSLREDSHAVASSVATLFTLVIVLLLLQASVIGTIPTKQYEAERLTSLNAIAAFDRLRSMAGAGGAPRYDPTEVAHSNASFQFVPRLFDARLTKIDQDVILAIDSSGSMLWNDPSRLRISGAKDYLTHLTCPDRVAIVDLDR